MAVEFYDWVFFLGFLVSTGITGFSMWKLAHLTVDPYEEKILRAFFLNAGNIIAVSMGLAGYFTSTLTGTSAFLFGLYALYIPLNLLYLFACIVWTIKERADAKKRRAVFTNSL